MDGGNYKHIATVLNNANATAVLNSYNWAEEGMGEKTFYKIKFKGEHTGEKYSKTIVLDKLINAEYNIFITNPFSNQLYGTVEIEKTGIIQFQLIDISGHIVKIQNNFMQQGKNGIMIKILNRYQKGCILLK